MTYEVHPCGDEYYICGFIDGERERRQVAFFRLMTEAGAYVIYGNDYGVRVRDIRGEREPYARAIYESRVTRAFPCSSLVFEDGGAVALLLK